MKMKRFDMRSNILKLGVILAIFCFSVFGQAASVSASDYVLNWSQIGFQNGNSNPQTFTNINGSGIDMTIEFVVVDTSFANPVTYVPGTTDLNQDMPKASGGPGGGALEVRDMNFDVHPNAGYIRTKMTFSSEIIINDLWMESFFNWTQGSVLKHLALQAYDAQGNAVVPVSWTTYGGSDVIAEINIINGDLWFRSNYPINQTTYSGAENIDYGNQPIQELNWYSWGYDNVTGMHLQNVLGSTLLGDINFTLPAPALYTLGDRVWYDQNQNGIQDPNEPGYNGITVELYANATCSGMPIASTVTGSGPAGFGDGYYQFSNLLAGDYCVQFEDIPAGWVISPANQGTDDALDSDANENAQITDISLTADDMTQDMGIYVPGSLGDSVICVSTGLGLANITVSLFQDFDGDGIADGPAIATTETDAAGFYQFTGLEVALAGDPNNTTAYIVTVDVNDPDLGLCNVPIPPTSYNPPLDSDNPNDPNNDFFFQQPDRYTLGDRVWFDNNADGVQDPDEPGIPGVVVNLTDCSDNILASDVTDLDGFYLFEGLVAGTYCVVIDQTSLPDNVFQTFEKDGTLDGNTQQVLNAGDVILDVDFGYVIVAVGLEKYTRVESAQTGADLCDTYGKPQKLTMLYTGDNIIDHAQDPSKVTITGNPMFASPVFIVASEKSGGTGRVYFTGQVALGETFVMDSTLGGRSELTSESWVTIRDLNGNVLQSIRFHTSCSQPLALGDQFGSIQLLGFLDKNGNGEEMSPTVGFGDDADTPPGPTAVVGDTIVWTYIVTNNGVAPLTDIIVIDDAGTPGDPGDNFMATPVEINGLNVGDTNGNGLLDPGEEWQFTASGIARLGQYSNLATVFAVGVGHTVTDDDPSHYLGVYSGANLCPTYGRPQKLTMLYTGDNIIDHTQDPSKVTITGNPMFATPVYIVASEKANGGGDVYFSGQVALGETFVIDSTAGGRSELRSDTWVTIYDLNGNVLQSIKFHTSCSQPLALGDQFGGIQLVGFVNKNGLGEGDIPAIRANLCPTYGKPQLLTMVYTGDNVVDHRQDPSRVTITGDPMFAALVHVVASEKANGGGDVYFSGQVALGETFVIDATLAGRSELRSDTWVTIYDLNGNVLQSIRFHTSCSQPLALEDQFGGIQLVGFANKNGLGEGDIPAIRANLCPTYGKPQLLTMVYTGDNVVDHRQDPSKVTITGNPMFAALVHVVASEKANGGGDVYFSSQVALGETFVIDSTAGGRSELRADTWVTIYDLNGNLLQSIRFHTSCSQPLALEDQFGGIQLVGFFNKNGLGEGVSN